MTTEKRTKIYLTQAHVGALATIAVLMSIGLGFNDFFKGLSVGIMIIPLIVMLIRRLRDEYIETLWQAGTSLAFATVVFCFLILPFLEGVADGFTGNGSGQDFPAALTGFAAIAAFYIGFHYRWLRDRI